MLDTYLYVNVSVTGEAFSIYLGYRKMLFDSFLVRSSPSAESLSAAEAVRGLGSATTWKLGSTGTHGNDEGFVTLHLSQALDEFLVEHLRVNEAACAKP